MCAIAKGSLTGPGTVGGGSFVNALTILRAGVDGDADRAGAGQASLGDGAHGRAVIIY